MISVEELRKYRLELPFQFNDQNKGIALFDLILTFVIAYILEPYILPFLMSYNINRKAYYLMLIPLGVIIHILFKQTTFLNKQLFSKELNIYKALFFLIIYLLLKELNLV